MYLPTRIYFALQPRRGGNMNNHWCNQWNMVQAVEYGATSGIWCNQWNMVQPVEYGATSGV
jgi:hypothetical protein